MMRRISTIALLLLITACQTDERSASNQQRQQIRATGELYAEQTQQISPPSVSRMWQYSIRQMAAESSMVEAGAVVVAFDGQTVQDELRNKQMELSSAHKELANQLQQDEQRQEELKLDLAEREMEYDRFKRRAEIVDHSRSANDRAKAQIDFTIARNQRTLAEARLTFHQQQRDIEAQLLQSRIARLQSEVSRSQRELASLQVTAPFAGMVLYVPNHQGEKSSVGDNVQFGQPVAAVSLLDTLKIRAELDEIDLRDVRVGQRVHISLDALPERSFNGVIEDLGRAVRDKSREQLSRVIEATIAFETLDPELMRPGMTARLAIQLRQQGDTE